MTIPKIVFSTWKTKNLPEHMRENYKSLISQNPDCKFYLYDDEDCRILIKKFFPEKILKTYDKLIPPAYKADLWRYCVLYKFGGIYLDIKFNCTNDFKLSRLTYKEHFVLDKGLEGHPIMDNGIYNGLLVCKPKSLFLVDCINEVIKNVNFKYYGNSPLSPTGPLMCKKIYDKHYNNIHFDLVFKKDLNIYYNDFLVITQYPEYRNEQQKLQKLPHYSILWDKKMIYK